MDNPEVMDLELNAVVLPVEDLHVVSDWYITQLDLDTVQQNSNSIRSGRSATVIVEPSEHISSRRDTSA